MAKEKVTVSVEDRLRALHQLQIIDSQVDKIRIVRGELPVEIEDLEDLIVGLKTRLEKLTNELDEVNTGLSAKQNSILDAAELVKKYEKQLKNIKNNREFSSLTKELEYKNLEIELNEKHVNDLQAKILHKKEIIEESNLQIKDREEELKVKNTALEAIVKETEKEEKALMKKIRQSSKSYRGKIIKFIQKN